MNLSNQLDFLSEEILQNMHLLQVCQKIKENKCLIG
jgi:hypothetical protein